MCRTNSQNNQNIGLPRDISLPFFAYGFFKKGELAYNLIKDCVDGEPVEDRVRGELYNKDGVPILVRQDRDYFSIGGNIIKFTTSVGYERVCDIEPGALYKWKEIVTENKVKANALVYKYNDNSNRANSQSFNKPKGAQLYDSEQNIDWHCKDDPLFKYGMEYLDIEYFSKIIDKTWRNDKSRFGPLKNYNSELYKEELDKFFDLQMAYVFLWTIIDRYCSLKYSLSSRGLGEKHLMLARSPMFSGCYQFIPTSMILSGVSNSTNHSTPERGYVNVEEKLIKNLYAIRNNAVHRGKALHVDYELLKRAFLTLYAIMHNVFSEEFGKGIDHNKIVELFNYRG